jgi:hypothetical protein
MCLLEEYMPTAAMEGGQVKTSTFWNVPSFYTSKTKALMWQVLAI